MSELLNLGLMAEKHWREFRPRMGAELETQNRLKVTLVEAQEQTAADLQRLTRQFVRQGLSPQQAHDQAWELVKEKFILLPPEEKLPT
ncbi:MAG TPA: hypothetical protein PLG56_01295 [Lacunisphaera sp.]|nr:hypothetical protein [Lacunisphaera sp.]